MASQGDHRQLRAWVREFIDRVVKPVARDLDRQVNPEDCFSWDIVEQADQVGLRTLTIDERYGGAGFDFTSTAVVVEELAVGDLGVSVMLAHPMKDMRLFQEVANEEQKERLLPKFVANPRALTAIGNTEPELGSDRITGLPGARYRTTAERVDGGWELNGTKHFISNGNRASIYLIGAQTDPDQDLSSGSTMFVVEGDNPGLAPGVVHDKLGERLANNSEVILTRCFVPDRDVLGRVNGGRELFRKAISASNAYAAAQILGAARGAYEQTLNWCATRVQGGGRLIDHDPVVTGLARMRMQLDVGRAYMLAVAHAADHPDQWDPTMAAFPKAYAAEAAWDVASRCMELHGGYGYMKDLGIEKSLRDLASCMHLDGTNHALLLKAAPYIRGEVGVGRG